MKSNINTPVISNVKVGGDVHKVRFVEYPNKVTITSRGLPKLTIKPQADGTFKAVAKNVLVRGKPVIEVAKTQQLAYKRIVAAAWTN